MKTESGHETWEHFKCNRECFPRGREDNHKRKAWRCSLTVLQGADPIPKGDWIPDYEYPGPHMGEYTDETSKDENLCSKYPKEGHEGGCPGGWYRCAFTDSLAPFEPLRSEGQYQRCHELDSTDSRLVHDWVRLLQSEQLRHGAYEMDQW